MGITFRVHSAARLVEYAVEGNPTADEAREFFEAVLAHPDFTRGFNFLGDRRGAHRTGTLYIQAIAAQVNTRCKDLAPCRWAVVVSGELAESMARLWAQMTGFSGVKICAFPTVEEAAEWLGIARVPPRPEAGWESDNATVDLQLPSAEAEPTEPD